MSRILGRAVADPAFRHRLLEDPKAAIGSSDLSEVEAAEVVSVFSRVDEAIFYQTLGALVLHHLIAYPVGERFIVLPKETANPQPKRLPIYLTKYIGFGNGSHPTTRLCIGALERLLRPGMSVLDMGTGSAILAVTAAKLGAARVLALDIEEEILPDARANVALNNVSSVVIVKEGSLELALQSNQMPFDLILVNILASVLQDFLRQGLTNCFNADGLLIASGITPKDVQFVETAITASGLKTIESQEEDGWVAIIARKT